MSRIKYGVVSLLMCGLTACSDGPADTAEQFLFELSHCNFENAKKLSTDLTGQMIDVMKMTGFPCDPNAEFEIVEKKIDGYQAVVSFREGTNKDSELQVIHLVKHDGVWKVNEQKR
ncbi:hypothetical protein [Thiorhodococcus drewsii]|nr:hypothetical protein [Thiorhodococcus drewsii]